MPAEYNGALPPAPVGAANYPVANQAAAMGALLESIGYRLRLWTRLRDKVKEWDNEERLPIEGSDCITYRMAGLQPGDSNGGGIARTPIIYQLEVTVWTVRRTDSTGDNTAWNRRHFAMCVLAINALHAQHIAGSYDAVGAPTSPPLTTAAVMWTGGNPFSKPQNKADWGKTILSFGVPSILPLVNPGANY